MTTFAQNDPVILSLDVGTQSVRAVAIDVQGKVRAIGKALMPNYLSLQPGWAEQPVADYWQALHQAATQLWQVAPNLRSLIVAVTLTTQRGSLVLSDCEGVALKPSILWLDQRKAKHNPTALASAWAWGFKTLGVFERIKAFETSIVANWHQQNAPDLWSKVAHYELLSGYLTRQLTGLKQDSIGGQVGYLPFDYKRQGWANAGDWRWSLSPIKPHMLSELVAPGTMIGPINDQSAAHLGLKQGTPFVVSAADKACEVLGCGGLSPDIACLSFGTTATLNLCSHRYQTPQTLMPPFPGAVPNTYNLEWMIYRGFWMVTWFVEQFSEAEKRLAADQGKKVEDILEALAAKVPPGSLGLTLQPYWSPGRRFPGPEAKGAIIGFGDVHQKGHLYRALLEGLAYALKQGLEQLQKRTGTLVKELRVSGGGSQSDLAMQITADVFGLPVYRQKTHETSALGAAINVAVGLGYYPDYQTSVDRMTGSHQVFQPNLKHHSLYQNLYQQVYRPLYPRLVPLYQAVQKITGYPGACS